MNDKYDRICDYRTGEHDAKLQSLNGKISCSLAAGITGFEAILLCLLANHIIPNSFSIVWCGVVNVVFIVLCTGGIVLAIRGRREVAAAHHLETVAVLAYSILIAFNSLGCAIAFFGVGNDV